MHIGNHLALQAAIVTARDNDSIVATNRFDNRLKNLSNQNESPVPANECD
jgi:hypothetical protein